MNKFKDIFIYFPNYPLYPMRILKKFDKIIKIQWGGYEYQNIFRDRSYKQVQQKFIDALLSIEMNRQSSVQILKIFLTDNMKWLIFRVKKELIWFCVGANGVLNYQYIIIATYSL
ncbi:hypothetical protein PPL_00288 [Heterostelium album PN500]|uniref:Uncharacterized protein n=1 Tax=Heterostelium pallidum (strain ATCC 26659 / Pp 5 / PN500) TaxID=670386 RepID=D3AW21_HETP5|nr:hypothetical protein PPL_00288 [Heterostelium album PN500]EFA86494.1 hypothetical protein PPL_00288 [Heterostelium album PN500]|eukprot:XP_020438599.1 hypothetical protein PPL_00288 [Heterostelium album PN500]